jgi:hypothetical protein
VKTKRQDFSKYVHEYTNKSGTTLYAVAEWDEVHAQWIRPLDASTRKITGCHSEYSKSLSGIGGYPTRRQALRRARYLFGETEQDQE